MRGTVKIERRDAVLALVLARPEKKNALTEAMYGMLADALEAADEDASVRAILLRAEGDSFTAGNDIGEFAAARAAGGGLRQVSRFIRAIARVAKPIVAAVQGRAVGIGATMLLHCDQVVLSEDAKLSAPFVSLGLVPEAASSLLLTARIGHPRAFAMFALGEVVGAREALAWGLANEVVAPGSLHDAAEDRARRLALQPPEALVAAKRLMRDAAAIGGRMDEESEEFARRLASLEAGEAFAAFAERRAPDFGKLDAPGSTVSGRR